MRTFAIGAFLLALVGTALGHEGPGPLYAHDEAGWSAILESSYQTECRLRQILGGNAAIPRRAPPDSRVITQAWNTLIDQPWKIMSIARRDCSSSDRRRRRRIWKFCSTITSAAWISSRC